MGPTHHKNTNAQIVAVTLGIINIEKSKSFYMEGFGWVPLHEDKETVMYQMNGFILSTWLQSSLEKDITKSALPRGGAITLAHNVNKPDNVSKLINILSLAGGKIIRHANTPSHGGVRGYIADPDDHIWEIIWNPAWKTDDKGFVTFSP